MSRNRELSQFPEFLTVNDTYGSVGIGTSLTVSGIGTFENDLYVAGTLYAPSLNIEGGATLGDDLTTRNISASGIVTVTGNTDLNGDLDVDGHTELDNVRISGVTTFQEDIYLGNDDRINLGGSNDLQIYHDGADSYIVDSGLGDLYIRGTAAIRFQNAGGTENYAVFNDTGSTDLYYDNTKRLETTNTGVNVTGNIVASGNVTVGGTLIYEDVTNVDSVGIATARSGLRITGGGLEVTGLSTFNDRIVGSATSNVIPFLYSTYADLPPASSYHGAFAHVHSMGKALYAHSGAWFELVNKEITGVVGTGTEIYDIGDLSSTQLNVSGVSTFTGNVDANGDLDVDGHTELDNLNVSGVSTFVGVVTSQSNVFVGDNLSVAGDATIVGVLTVGSSSITIDGSTNTINVGTGVTIHTTTASLNQLEVAGLSTFVGVGTFQDNLFVGGTLYTPALVVDGSSLGDDINTRNISASGIVTVTGDADINGDLDVEGHTELDGVNIAGVLTATSAEFSGNVTVLGDLTYENVLNVDSVGIATARAGLRVTGGGLEVSGVSTFSGIATASSSLFTNQLSVSGVSTFGVTNGGTKIDEHGNITLPDTVGASGILRIGTTNPTTFKQNIISTPASAGQHIYIMPGNEQGGTFNYNGSVDLFYDNSKKFETTGAGIKVTGGVEATGVSTFSGNIDLNADLDVDGHAEFDNVNVSGVITATSFVGNGSQLTGVSGFATALSDDSTSPLNKIFKTPKTLYIPPNTQTDIEVGAYEDNTAFMRESIIEVGIGATFNIEEGTTVKTNILDVFEVTPDNLTVDNLTVVENTYITGIITATTFYTAAGDEITAGGGLNFQEFTSNGTWTKPAGVTWVKIEVIGGGGGGGSGRVGGNANGGNGGSGSPIVSGIWAASSVPDSATITIGAGGAGGAAQTADSTDGNAGADGGTSSFGTFFAPDIYGQGGGAGKNSSAYNSTVNQPFPWPRTSYLGGSFGFGAYGTNNRSYLNNDTGDEAGWQSSTATTYHGRSSNAHVCAGGGGGGGVISGAATYTAGGHGGFGSEGDTPWVSFATVITEGRNGNDAPTGSRGGGFGGTGNRTGNGGNGGDGSTGAGGGGGAGVPDTYDSGAGGNGGDGRIRVWAW